MFSVAVRTPDVVGERMAGPGIRAWQLARELGRHFPTTLVARLEGETPNGVRVVAMHSPEATEVLRGADVLIGQPSRGFGRARREQKIAFDLFDPNVLELRELYGAAPSIRQRIHLAAEWMRLLHAMRSGDLLISAAHRQRHFYGKLQSSDTPWVNVPFGIDPDEVLPPTPRRENIVVWGGGTWEWLDPVAAVDAIATLNREGLPCELLFLGRSRPNRALVDRRRESRFDDLLSRGAGHVTANEEWIPYRHRLSWIRSAKVSIMLHRRTGEAEYSIRTRLFDAIATGTPLVATAGGFAANLVAHEGLGIVVPPEDPVAVTRAIRRLLTDDAFHAACVSKLESLRSRFAWSEVARPLVEIIMDWRKRH